MRSLTDLDGTTQVVGVIGWPVRHSLSPPMHNAALAQMGLNWVYVPFEVSPTRIAQALEGVRALGMVGINVTVPHKEAVAGLVDELGEIAGALGAVNTVCNRDGVLYGYNTDGEGFVRSLRRAGGDVAGRRVALVGAGGAARAVAYAIAREKAACLSIIGRTPRRAEEVAQLVAPVAGGSVEALPLDSVRARVAVQQADIVVDSTPCGMHPHSDDLPAIPEEWLGPGQLVCDLVYTPRETCLLRAARRKGAQTVDGTGMLVHQGAIALERWTGLAAPVDVMERALVAALEARETGRPG